MTRAHGDGLPAAWQGQCVTACACVYRPVEFHFQTRAPVSLEAEFPWMCLRVLEADCQ